MKERGFHEDVLRKVRESQVTYFVSLYNVTISLLILGLLKNSMNRSTTSGEEGGQVIFLKKGFLLRELFDILTSTASYN